MSILKLKPNFVEPIKIPTEFAKFDLLLKPTSKDYVDCSGCENIDASDKVINRISKAIKNHPELIWDHWESQDINLRTKIAKLHKVNPDQVFITSGAIGGIDYFFKIFSNSKTKTGLLKPDWPGFEYFCDFYKNKKVFLENLEFPFLFNTEVINSFIKTNDLDCMIFANPIPIQGQYLSIDDIESILSKHPQTIFLIDEADTINEKRQCAELTTKFDNCIFLGSLSKYYGLSGLRIGYLIAPKILIECFAKTISPAEVSSISILAGNIAMEDEVYLKQTQTNTLESIKLLEKACENTQFQIYSGGDCFACFIYSKNVDICDLLMKHEIKILNAKYFGLPSILFGGRINLSNPQNVQKIANVIAKPQFHIPLESR
jgi:histidinol-phosphate/aromatic aminotransferase/cobyric acid decarboxylase-like protein